MNKTKSTLHTDSIIYIYKGHFNQYYSMLGIRSVLKRDPRSYQWLTIRRSIKHKANFKTSDSTVDTDEIMSQNNPWSPTLYNDAVRIRKPNSFRSTALPENYRLSYKALYESPSAKYVAMIKRLTLSFAVLGVYGAKLLYESVQFDDIYAWSVLLGCGTPAIAAQYKTRDYVMRIFRLYDKDKPQTLQNLVQDEKLIMEKLNMTGGQTYNELLTVSNNPSLKLTQSSKLPAALTPYSTWQEIDPESGKERHFYVADDIGGLKMDRLWGIVEHNSGVENGRYMEDQIQQE